MKRLQEEIFSETEKVIGKFSILKVVIYTLISTIVILLLLIVLNYPVGPFEITFAVTLSFIYSALRDYLMARYSKKLMKTYYHYLLSKKRGIELYIPLFQKTKQGVLLKKASLYFYKGELYLEAFDKVRGKSPKESITVKRGREFTLGHSFADSDPKVVSYKAKLNKRDEMNFSIVNNTELINLIENKK